MTSSPTSPAPTILKDSVTTALVRIPLDPTDPTAPISPALSRSSSGLLNPHEPTVTVDTRAQLPIELALSTTSGLLDDISSIGATPTKSFARDAGSTLLDILKSAASNGAGATFGHLVRPAHAVMGAATDTVGGEMYNARPVAASTTSTSVASSSTSTPEILLAAIKLSTEEVKLSTEEVKLSCIAIGLMKNLLKRGMSYEEAEAKVWEVEAGRGREQEGSGEGWREREGEEQNNWGEAERVRKDDKRLSDGRGRNMSRTTTNPDQKVSKPIRSAYLNRPALPAEQRTTEGLGAGVLVKSAARADLVMGE
ncbi:hypothetical protein BDK51DRAFT_28867 [Blyttiomyces helicus]|uniref:Uncharacterized protein n=1 Tax=Blyttiomyces helicus TaxID=388810 RepID=A0A4P9WQY3_9FUNG|nr:hypothetical protein BDK51DRAFT_28867 [Blyttiomyces helicus]|eukprot:RKO94613.1 hypothetical protein BDK51DRAFT_28867 [Blyttiomyces helicus]